jgi:hypothetical protein
MWSRWRLSTLLYFLSLSERILGEIQQILKKSNRKCCPILGIRYLIYYENKPGGKTSL